MYAMTCLEISSIEPEKVPGLPGGPGGPGGPVTAVCLTLPARSTSFMLLLCSATLSVCDFAQKALLLIYSVMYWRISLEEEKEPGWPGGPAGPGGPGGPEVTEIEPVERLDSE